MCSAREHDSHFNGIFSFDGCKVLTMFWLAMILFCHWPFQYHCNRFLFTFYWKFYGISWIQSYSIPSNFNDEEETQLKIFCNFFYSYFCRKLQNRRRLRTSKYYYKKISSCLHEQNETRAKKGKRRNERQMCSQFLQSTQTNEALK